MSQNTNRLKHFPDDKSPNILSTYVPDKAFLQNKRQLEENCIIITHQNYDV